MNSGKEAINLVLLEFEDEAEAFLRYCKNTSASITDFFIIALQPEVQIFFKRLDISYENTLAYFSNRNHERAIVQSEKWYLYLSQRINITDGTEIKETYNNSFLFYFRLYMHHFLFYVEICLSLAEKYDIASLYACVQRKLPLVGNPLISNEERYLGIIAEIFAQNNNILFHEIPITWNGTKIINNKLSSNIFESIVAKLYKYFLFKFLKNKKIILLTTKGYNVAHVVRKLRQDFPEIKWVEVHIYNKNIVFVIFYKLAKLLLCSKSNFYLPMPIELYKSKDPNIARAVALLDKSFQQITEKMQNEWYDTFYYNRINFISLFKDKIQHDIKPSLINLCLECVALKNILKNINVNLVISPYARHSSLLLGELCHYSSIPTLMISHGTLQKPKNNLEGIENYHLGNSMILCKFYKHVALQTPNDELTLDYYASKNERVKTGPLILSKVDASRKNEFLKKIIGPVENDTKILFYPENTRWRDSIRFYVFETSDEFLSSVTDLVNAIQDIEKVYLVIRLHPRNKIMPQEFRTLLPSSEKLIVMGSKEPFYQVLTIADLVINFSSTAIDDALRNYVPVLLYDKWNRYMHYRGQELTPDNNKKKNGVYYINNSAYLQKGIQWILDNHLRKDASNAIFRDYVYNKDYFVNFIDFVSRRVGRASCGT